MDWIAGIIMEGKIHASEYTKLNDPMEGTFWHYGLHKDLLEKIERDKKKWRICSFSKKWDNHLMWTFYANLWKGIVIGIDEKSLKLQYGDNVSKISYSGISDVENDNITSKGVKEILSCKTKDWQYEKEVRVFTEDDFITVEIEKVILGYKISHYNKLIIELLVNDVNRNRTKKIEIVELNKEILLKTKK